MLSWLCSHVNIESFHKIHVFSEDADQKSGEPLLIGKLQPKYDTGIQSLSTELNFKISCSTVSNLSPEREQLMA